jgi:CheY-like chemotaxis protein
MGAPVGDDGSDQAPACGHLRILLVDDEPDVLESVGGMLTGMGHTVIRAANGIEALQQVSGQDCDVIITDLGMPAMNGVELARQLREFAPRRPVILLTGWAGEFERQHPDGVDRVQPKPVTMRQLAEALAAVTSPMAA